MKITRLSLAAVLLGALATVPSAPVASLAEEPAAKRDGPVFQGKLPNVPGQSLTVVVVRYGPGQKSARHRHAGSVFAYVLSGSIRSENSVTGPARVYQTGEGFFEPAGSEHLVSENASTTEPASLLAIFVADDGAKLTTYED
jgi:quercetin dioxygenase-like cupin family protein